MKHSPIFAIILLVLTFCACQEDVAHRFCAVDSQNWEKQYKARFHIDPLGLQSEYNLRAEVRADKRYLYKDLWMVVETRVSGDSILSYCDTICLNMVKENGEMNGNGLNIQEYKMAVRCLPLTPTDTIDICMRHIMSATSLPGVHDIGFMLSPIWK